MEFDPYSEWLSILSTSRPPNHYELLGLPWFEDDQTAVNQAYESRTAEIRKFQAGQRGEEAQRLLDELADAYVCLSDVVKKEKYDESLLPPDLQGNPFEGERQADPASATETEQHSLPPPIPQPPQEDASTESVPAKVKTRSIWSVDIDSFALKAIRLYCDPAAQCVVATGYEYIEHAVPLTQAQGSRSATLRKTLDTFVRCTSTQRESIAITLPGNTMISSLAKFPIIESKEIPATMEDIAETDLSASIDDLEWDYQAMWGHNAGGFVVNAEFGIFAVQRETLSKWLEPFDDVGVHVSHVQFRPLALHNFAVHELGLNAIDPTTFDPDDPPAWTCLLSIDAVDTEIVLTNGCRMWRESIDMGSNEFAGAISVQLDVKIDEAEALRRDPSKQGNAGEVFDAIQYVYRDFALKLRILLAQFNVVFAGAQIDRIVMLGTAIDRMGLEAFLSRELEITTELVDSYDQLNGIGIKKSPGFRNHLATFAACYGLGLQALNVARVQVNLLPEERHRSAWLPATAGAGVASMLARWNRFADWLTHKRNRVIFNLIVVGALALIGILAIGCIYLLRSQ